MCYFITISEKGCRPPVVGHVNSAGENDAVYKEGGCAVTLFGFYERFASSECIYCGENLFRIRKCRVVYFNDRLMMSLPQWPILFK